MFMPASTILFAILLENMLHDIRKQVCTLFLLTSLSQIVQIQYRHPRTFLLSFYCPNTTFRLHHIRCKISRKSGKSRKRSVLRQIFFHPRQPANRDTQRIPMFPQCPSYSRKITESSSAAESKLWQTSPRICLTACQRFLLLSILICSVNKEAARGGFAAASLQHRGGTKIVVTPSAQEQW